MNRSALISSLVLLLAISPGAARASTVIPAVMGATAGAAGVQRFRGALPEDWATSTWVEAMYNYDTSIARSINADTAMGAEPVHVSVTPGAGPRYHAGLQADLNRINKAQAGIYDRLHNSPRNTRHHRRRCLERVARHPAQPGDRRLVAPDDQDSAQGGSHSRYSL